MSKEKWVYISSPYTNGDVEANVKIQMDTFVKLKDAGFVPIAPLLLHFIHIDYPRDYEFWFDACISYLKRCDILLRLPGESGGADREVEEAKKLGIETYFGMDDLLNG